MVYGIIAAPEAIPNMKQAYCPQPPWPVLEGDPRCGQQHMATAPPMSTGLATAYKIPRASRTRGQTNQPSPVGTRELVTTAFVVAEHPNSPLKEKPRPKSCHQW